MGYLNRARLCGSRGIHVKLVFETEIHAFQKLVPREELEGKPKSSINFLLFYEVDITAAQLSGIIISEAYQE